MLMKDSSHNNKKFVIFLRQRAVLKDLGPSLGSEFGADLVFEISGRPRVMLS